MPKKTDEQTTTETDGYKGESNLMIYFRDPNTKPQEYESDGMYLKWEVKYDWLTITWYKFNKKREPAAFHVRKEAIPRTIIKYAEELVE